MSAYLELFIGPMFSGKTSKLLEIYKQNIFCKIPIIVINHSSDTRYHQTMLSTHDKIMIPCIQTTHLLNIWNYADLENPIDVDLTNIHFQFREAQVILINEGQFFPDLIECVEELLKEKKKVYICGLDGDFERKKFGAILDLIPMCDKVTKMTSLCGICKDGTPGIFSLRLTKEKEQFLIGSDNYIPVCRECYINLNKNEIII
jgi:thymidine kinase